MQEYKELELRLLEKTLMLEKIEDKRRRGRQDEMVVQHHQQWT